MNIAVWSSLLAFIMPMAVAAINHENWSSWVKALVALAASAVGGTISALLAGNLTGVSWLTGIGIVFTVSQVFYHTWFKGSGISDAIEKKVNISFLGSSASAKTPPASAE